MSTENTTAVSTDNSAAASAEKKMIELKSSDGENFQVEEKVAVQSVTIKNLVDDGCGDSVIPVPNVTAEILAKVIEYCKRHVEDSEKDAKEEDAIVKANDKKVLDAFDAEFVKVEQDVLFDLILAANYLNIPGLLDLTCQTVADMMKGKTPEQIRETFHIINDYTPEEEEEVRRENAWAFE